MPEVSTDLRCGARFPCDLRVLVMVHPGVFGPGVLLNVSISGALLQTPLVLSPLTQIELEVQSPGMGRSSIMASITRRELNEYGVIFRGNNNTAIARMLRLVQSRAEAVQGSPAGEALLFDGRGPTPLKLRSFLDFAGPRLAGRLKQAYAGFAPATGE